MITLYGFAISNYYNKIKLALIEKQINFNEVALAPSQDEAILKRSPLGKIPFIETEDGQFLSESQAIFEYLEEAYPEHPLYPTNVFERAKTREFIQHIELNVELIARRIYGKAFFGSSASDEVLNEVKTKVETGLIGLNKLLKFNPYVLGENFTAADVIAWPHLQVIGLATQTVYGSNLVSEIIPATDAYLKLIEQRPSAQRVSTDRALALAKFFKTNNP